VNAPTQRTQSGLTQRTTRVVANAITSGVRQMPSSGSKAKRQGKNQGLNATVQEGDASTKANVSSANVPDSNNSGPNASLRLELGS